MSADEIKHILESNNLEPETKENLIRTLTSSLDDFDRKDWMECILKLTKVLSTSDGIEKAWMFEENAIKSFTKVNPRAFILKSQMKHELAVLQLKDGKVAQAMDTSKSFLYNQIARLFNDAPNETTEYYSFRGFSDYSIDDIKNDTISVAHPREFNDPLDTIFSLWLDKSIASENIDRDERNFRMLLKKVSEHIKMRCMIEASYKNDDGNMEIRHIEDLDSLMWAHYADSHKGFCVRYSFKDDFFHDFSSTEDVSIRMMCRMKYTDDLSLGIEKIPDMESALLTKSNNWKYENETRLVSFDIGKYSGKGDKISEEPEFPVFDCPGAAKAIFLGVKCTDKDRRRMEVAIGDKNIELYQMKINDSNITKLKAERIG